MQKASYKVFMVDPPWQQRKGGCRKIRPGQGRLFNYATMPINEIFRLLDERVFISAAGDHCVFIWAIEKYLQECETQMTQRGYKRHCRLVWDKTNGIAPAFTIRFCHEYLLWYYKQRLLPVASGYRGKFTSVFAEPSREHSRKPDCSYHMVDCLYPGLPKIDVFSREKRNGWDQYGDETNYYRQK
jgi:N6-adenosine-specific RNA methylase IME4